MIYNWVYPRLYMICVGAKSSVYDLFRWYAVKYHCSLKIILAIELFCFCLMLNNNL